MILTLFQKQLNQFLSVEYSYNCFSMKFNLGISQRKAGITTYETTNPLKKKNQSFCNEMNFMLLTLMR